MHKMLFALIFLAVQAAAEGYDDLTGHRKDSLYAPRYDPNAWRGMGAAAEGSLRDSSGSAVVDSSGESVGHGSQAPDGKNGNPGSRGNPSGFGSEVYRR